MSLQEISSLPPNKIVDERGEGNRGGGYRSAQRLSQLTERAVDKALKLQAESGRLVDVVDTESCGELGEYGCLMKYPFSPSASKILKNTTILIPSSFSRSWALPKESQDRRTVAAKIYSSLIQWRSEVSFEWRSRVVLAVPVLEEALYKVARSKEDYASQQLLEHVLLHFEAGNGLFLLQGTKPLYPVQASHSASTMGQDTSEHVICGTGDSCEITHDDALPWENANVLHANNDLSSGLESESCLTDTSFLWDGLEIGHTTTVKVAVHKHRDNPGKRITNRVVSMLSKRSDNVARLRHEIMNAAHSEENIPSAGVRVDDARTEMRKQNDGESFEPSNIKQESPCYGDMRTRKNARKTLGDMINMNLTNLTAIGSSLSNNVDEARLMSFMNEGSNCSKHSDTVHSFCTLNSYPRKMEAKGPFPSSSNVALKELSQIKLMQPSSDKAKQSTGSSSLQGLPTTLTSSPRHTAALQPSPTPPKPKTSTPCRAHSSSTSPASPAPFSSLLSSSSSTMSSIASSALSQVSSLSTTTVSLAPSLSQVSSSLSCVLSSSLSLSSVASLSSSSSSHEPSSSVSLSSSSHTAQISASTPLRLAPSSPPTELSIQPFHCMPPSPACLEGEQSQEFREQLTKTATTSQEIEREAARRSSVSTTLTATASNDSLPEARERGARLPLSIFLSEKDEFDVFSMAGMSGDSGSSWSTWEEPTEQIDPLCCVCMVGLKGAAFIPCGHTFCRKCSRELWRGRGSCPLCNRYIREILDVY